MSALQEAQIYKIALSLLLCKNPACDTIADVRFDAPLGQSGQIHVMTNVSHR